LKIPAEPPAREIIIFGNAVHYDSVEELTALLAEKRFTPPKLDRPSVLIAHTHEADLLRIILEDKGYSVATAAKFDEALILAEALRPAVIVTHTLFNLTGGSIGISKTVVEFLHELRRNQMTRGIKTVIFSISKHDGNSHLGVDEWIWRGADDAFSRLCLAINQLSVSR
jgi:CheY-like chemotaxis protein